MINSKHRFTLEIQAAHSQIAIPCMVGDTGKTLYISLTDGGKPYTVPENTLAMLTIHRPTGTFLQAFCPIINRTTVMYDFLQNINTAAVSGIHDCELTLYGATTGSVLSTSWFTLVVNEKVVDSDSINITDVSQNAVDAMILAEASRQANEESRVNAEAARVAAEEARVIAERARESASAESGTAASMAIQMADEAVNKSIQATNAANEAKQTANTAYLMAGEALNATGAKELPSVTTADNGKVLTVVGGKWVAEEIEEYDGEVEVS